MRPGPAPVHTDNLENRVHISIDTNESLTAMDRQILAVLTGGAVVSADEAETPKAAAPKAAPAAKKAAAPKADPAPAAEEDLVGDGPTMADAVALATKLVADNQKDKLKEALAAVGAGRVSEVTEDKLAEFVAALS